MPNEHNTRVQLQQPVPSFHPFAAMLVAPACNGVLARSQNVVWIGLTDAYGKAGLRTHDATSSHEAGVGART